MNRWIAGFAVGVVLGGGSQSNAVVIPASEVLNDWMQGPTPLGNGPSLNPDMVWTLADGGIETTNGSGGLMSDFSIATDFSFSVRWKSLPFPAGGWDNDLWGMAFGYQDASNHYRLGWGGGGYPDQGPYGLTGTKASGLFLARESGGMSTLLFNDSSLLWQNDVDYDATVFRTGDEIGFSVVRVSDGLTLASHTLTDSDFIQGHLGVYVDSQMSRFTNFDVNVVPEPSTLIIWSLLGGFGIGAGWRRRKKPK